MKTRACGKRVSSALLATTLALSASVAIAQDKTSGDSAVDERTLAQRACMDVGCNGGNRICGTVSWSAWLWMPTPYIPVPWLFTMGSTCYEPPTPW